MARILLFLFALLSVSHAQLPPFSQEIRSPNAPADFIYDPDSYFRSRPTEKELVAQTIQRIRKTYNFDVYIAVFGVTSDDSVNLATQKLYTHWFNADEPRDGIVYGFDIQNRIVAIARRPNQSTEHIAENEKGRIPDHRLSQVLNAVKSRFNETFENNDPKIERIEQVSTILMLMEEELEREITPEEVASHFHPSRPPLFKALLISLIVAAPFFFLFLWFKRKVTKVRQTFYFPESEIQERLGGASSGGTASSIRFTVKKP